VAKPKRHALRGDAILLLGFLFSAVVQADALPDPTLPLNNNQATSSVVHAAGAQLPNLQSIIYGKRRRAILDGQICHEGSVIGRYRVKVIYANRVVIEADGTLHTLKLFSHKVRYE
jgi:hypothetical protein